MTAPTMTDNEAADRVLEAAVSTVVDGYRGKGYVVTREAAYWTLLHAGHAASLLLANPLAEAHAARCASDDAAARRLLGGGA